MGLFEFRTYALLSFVITALVTYQQAALYQQFFPTMVKMFTQRLSRLIMFNNGIVFIMLFGKLLAWIFLGKLRPLETEKTWELSCVHIIETCLALTIFREEITFWIFAAYAVCLFFKNFHWLAQYRVQHLETQQSTGVGSMLRIYMLLTMLLVVDTLMIYHYYQIYAAQGIGIKILFLTEYLIQIVSCISIMMRLTMHAFNECYEAGLPYKDVYLFYLEIISDLLQSGIYIVFFIMLSTKYGLPIHLIREIYMTVRSAAKRIADLHNYRKNVVNWDKKFADASPQELTQAKQEQTNCVICRHAMESAKKLPCGHMYHAHCLRGWLEDRRVCPVCEAPVDQDAYKKHVAEKKKKETPATDQQQQQQQQPNIEEQINEQEIRLPAMSDEDLLQYIQAVLQQQVPAQQQQQVPLDQNAPIDIQQLQPVQLVPNAFAPNDLITSLYLQHQMLANRTDPQMNAVMRDMYIKYLEAVQKLTTEAIAQLKQMD